MTPTPETTLLVVGVVDGAALVLGYGAAAVLVAAVWGLWHMVTGLLPARPWRGRSRFATAPTA